MWRCHASPSEAVLIGNLYSLVGVMLGLAYLFGLLMALAACVAIALTNSPSPSSRCCGPNLFGGHDPGCPYDPWRN